MKRFFSFLAFAAVVVFISGCMSMSTLQTAKTTHQGEFAYGTGVGYVSTDLDFGDTIVKFSMPMVEAVARFGITDWLDVGLRWTVPYSIMFDTKVMFLGDKESTFAASIGAGVGFMNLTSGSYENKYLDIMVPVYASYHPFDGVSLYLSPKYIMRRRSYSDTEDPSNISSELNHWYGASLGLKLGKESWRNNIFIEGALMDNSVGLPFTQFMIGVGRRIR